MMDERTSLFDLDLLIWLKGQITNVKSRLKFQNFSLNSFYEIIFFLKFQTQILIVTGENSFEAPKPGRRMK